jgi:hypothetical protein
MQNETQVSKSPKDQKMVNWIIIFVLTFHKIYIMTTNNFFTHSLTNWN